MTVRSRLRHDGRTGTWAPSWFPWCFPFLILLALLGTDTLRWPRIANARVLAADGDIVRTIGSARYTLTLTTQPDLVPPPDRARAGGAIEPLGDGFLLVTAAGQFYRLSWEPDVDRLRAERLALSAPFNRTELIDKLNGDPADAAPFRVTDLLVDERERPARVYLSHHHFDADASCVTLRVSSAPLPETRTAAEWTTMFDSTPCMPLDKLWPRGAGADSSGGRMELHPGGLLLTVGDHGGDGADGLPAFSQDTDSSYGKVLLVNPGRAVPFTIGHRNPQGLAVDSEGHVWSTEHGPEGGDEVNLLVEGDNYGWPLATYGTAYGKDTWPLAEYPRSHGRFHEPTFAFVPSVGVSELIQVTSDYLPDWKGDLLVGSLKAALLIRLRLAGERVVFEERINPDMRIRDIAQGRDGRFVLWNDDGHVATLARATSPPGQ